MASRSEDARPEDAMEAPGLRRERQRLRQQAKEAEERRRRWRRRLRRASRIGLPLVVVGGVLGGLATWFGSRGELPPTSMANHVEVNPPGHILDAPMPGPVQKHMLEHADGIHGGPQGVIIQYNCKKFACPGDLVDNLTRMAKAFPRFVYLAPNPTMDARIAVTRDGEILVLDQYDAEKMRRFIDR